MIKFLQSILLLQLLTENNNNFIQVAGILAIYMLEEPWQMQDFAATMLALLGMVFIAKPSFLFGSTDGQANAVGVVYALLASFFAGFAFIYVRMLGVMKVP